MSKVIGARGSSVTILIDRESIKNYIPHREPFLLLDGVLELEHGLRILAVKRFSPGDEFFKGHFPANPIVPGVLIVEALAQAGGVLYNASFIEELKARGQSGAYLAGLEKVRFRKAVYPDDLIKLEVRILKRRSKIIIFTGEASVGVTKVAEAEIIVSLY
ncbi:MAG: 3-hydroxyacyl-ACP dehydratase FabZ [Thermodesulfobacteriota bacterium]